MKSVVSAGLGPFLAVLGRSALILLAVVVAGVLPGWAGSGSWSVGEAAESASLKVKRMTIDVKPEYDTPDVLVTYLAVYSNDSELPSSRKVRFKIPKEAELGQTCEIDKNGNHFCQLPEASQEGAFKEVSWDMGRSLGASEQYLAYLEFYYNPIQGAPDKRILYSYTPVEPVESLEIHVTQPARSTNYKSEPSPVSSGMSGNLSYHAYNFSSVQADQPVMIDLSYTKADSKPSVKKEDVTGAMGTSGQSQAPGAGPGSSKNTAMVAVAVVLALALGFLLYYGSRPRKPAAGAAAHRGTSRGRVDTHASGSSRGQGSGASARKSGAASGKGRPERPLETQAGRGRGGTTDPENERRRARRLLLDGKISEETYNRLLAEIDRDKAR